MKPCDREGIALGEEALMKPSDIEKRLSETPAPFVRDGLHRAELKRKLLDAMEESAMTTETRTSVRQPSLFVERFRAHRWRWIGSGVVAIGIVLGLLQLYSIIQMQASLERKNLIATVIKPTERETLNERLGEQRREGLRRRSLGESVEQAEVILVATPVESTIAPPKVKGDAPENVIRSVVTRVLKGKWDKKEVLTRTPTSFDEFVGREWIIMLSPEFVAGKHPFAGMYTIKSEAEIKQAVENEKK
jgi:hypothetical protein